MDPLDQSLDLVLLMKRLIDGLVFSELSGMVEVFEFADGTTRLQSFGPNFDLEMDDDVPRETVYVLLGQGFLVQLLYRRYCDTDKTSFVLEKVEGMEQAMDWLRSQLASGGLG